MSKHTKLAVFIGAVAAVVSAIVLVIVFWDKLLDKCPCRKMRWEDEDFAGGSDEEPEDKVLAYDAQELADYADLQHPEAE